MGVKPRRVLWPREFMRRSPPTMPQRTEMKIRGYSHQEIPLFRSMRVAKTFAEARNRVGPMVAVLRRCTLDLHSTRIRDLVEVASTHTNTQVSRLIRPRTDRKHPSLHGRRKRGRRSSHLKLHTNTHTHTHTCTGNGTAPPSTSSNARLVQW